MVNHGHHRPERQGGDRRCPPHRSEGPSFTTSARAPALTCFSSTACAATHASGTIRSNESDRYTCTTYDRRGHSRSPGGDRVGSDATHADDAAALIEALGLEPVVVASSGGARITVELLRRSPDLVRGAVLSEPPLFSLDPDAALGFRAQLMPMIERGRDERGPGGAVDAFFAFVCPGLWGRIDNAARDRYRANAPAMFAEFDATPNSISAEDLAGVRTPALVISGVDSHPALRAIATRLARALPNPRWIEFADCGHVTYAEQPERFSAAVAVFAHEIFHTATPNLARAE